MLQDIPVTRENVIQVYRETFLDKVRSRDVRRYGKESEFALVNSDGYSADQDSLNRVLVRLGKHIEAIRTHSPASDRLQIDLDKGDGKTETSYAQDIAANVEVSYEGRRVLVGHDMGTGQVEVAFTPFQTISEIKREADYVMKMIVEAAEQEGLSVLGYGIHPRSRPGENIMVQKERYQVLVHILGEHVLGSVLNTAEQGHIDIMSGEDPAEMSDFLLKISPFVLALFTNSHLYLGEVNGYANNRERTWDICVGKRFPKRIGIPEYFGSLSGYVEHTLGLKPLFTVRDNGYEEYLIFNETVDSIGKYLEDGRAEVMSLNGERRTITPTLEDLLLFGGSFWFNARPVLKYGTVEWRVADQQPPEARFAYIALLKGLTENRAAVESVFSDINMLTARSLRKTAICRGLHDKTLKMGARELVNLARNGLDPEEREFLDPLEERLRTGKQPFEDIKDPLELVEASKYRLEHFS